MSADGAAIRALAARWVAAMNQRDAATADELLAPEVMFWTNVGHPEIPKEQRLTLLQYEWDVLSEFAWYGVITTPFDGGCLLQMGVRGTTVDGSFDTSMCSILHVEGDRIVRVESYVNPGALEVLSTALQAHVQPDG